MKQLSLEDTGTYWCGIDKPYADIMCAINVKIVEASPGPHSALSVGTQPPSGSSTLAKKRPPPPPPGHKRTLSDPPSPQNKGVTQWGNDFGPASTNKTSTGNKFDGITQQQSTGTTKSTLGPRVLPKLPQKVALRKIDTIHHPSIDKPSQPPEAFQKSPQPVEIPQKPQLREKPQPVDLPPKPQIGDLPPKPGELPPKPQLSDLPPKPQLGDLPPKPQVKDLPPKPQLTEMPPKPQSGESLQKPPPLEVAAKPQHVEIPSNLSGDAVQNQPSDDTNGTSPSLPEMPVPLPRKINAGKNKVRRVKTIYDCQADNDDELTFVEGEVIIVTGEEDQEWWVSVPVNLLMFI
ncbi:Arf-GAP with SH3 domain, ANK repeat and PH domain-containing protein 1 [Acipenser ruthenus]|uniref:Arf-GAP with SH3 domain, ANK repeat and PH domain-containing protein 1 n=1 Tax=Acipenser ruthenus TaxID=7906 RepID=A0A662YMG8_ACIRT|nr:Arf-GAP with SH3 domain, ANK repeat and PH domain-containing protein 1 [Acipenser ruthenus]